MSASPGNITFQQFGPEDGLSQSTITALLQDRYGFIWVGTQGGLNRFDGYEFRTFRSDPTADYSICNNDINCLLEDDAGLLWIGTGDGLSVFDPATEQFYSFFNDPSDTLSLNGSAIASIYQASNGDLFVGTPQGLNKLIRPGQDYSQWQFYRYPAQANPDSKHLSVGIVRSICEDKQGRIWLAVSYRIREAQKEVGALTCFDPKLETFSHYYHDPAQDNSISSNGVSFVFCDDTNTLWLGTIDGGLNKIQLAKDGTLRSCERFTSDPANPNSIPHNYIHKIIQDKDGAIWIATYDGVAKYQPQSATFQIHRYNASDDQGLSAPRVLDLLSDSANNLWIGTENGLCLFTPSTKAFKSYAYTADDENGLAGGDIFGILEDSDGEVWIASYGAGISRIIPQSDGAEKTIFYSANAEGKRRLPTNLVLDFAEDHEQNIWGASFNGLLKIKKSEGGQVDIKQFQRNATVNSVSSNYFTQVYSLETNKIWAKTFQNGFDEIEFAGENLTVTNHASFTMGNEAFKVLSTSTIDNEGAIWLATDRAFFLAVPRKTEGLKYVPVHIKGMAWERLLKQEVRAYFRSSSNALWIGTGNGLFEVVFENGIESAGDTLWATATLYTEKDGLPDNTIYAIESDSRDNLWLSTNKGLARFSLLEKTSRNFDVADGLPGNEFNQYAVEKGKDGSLYFGGIAGFVKFHPDSIQDNLFIPPVQLTAFKIMNEDVDIDFQDASRLKRSILTTDEIQILPNDYVFSLEFAALNYNKPEKNTYAYKLEGFHDQWIYLDHQRTVTFTNLDPGQYNLIVKASNNDGVWNEVGTSLKITVLPPLWRSSAAYVLYFLLFTGMIWGIFILRARKKARESKVRLQIEAAKVEERERVRKKTSQDFHDEAGSRLTKITLLTELASRTLPESGEVQEYLQRIKENTRELSTGMRDFLWILDAGKDSLFDTIKRIEAFGNTMFQYSDIQFSVSGVTPPFRQIHLSMEARRTIILIFKEGMNNCLKYSSARNVSLNVALKKNDISIVLEDDGSGFKLDELSEGYGLGNMKARAESIGGKLDIISKPGRGTSICFRYNMDPVKVQR